MMALVMVQVVASAVIGLLLGSGVGIVITRSLEGTIPGFGFVLGVVLLALFCAVVASVPPALAAARTDPVRILRVP